MTKNIYLLSKKYPPEEKFGMYSQIRRAARSITNNLAEGTARFSGKEQARFTEISYGSLMEVLNELIAAVDLGYLTQEEVVEQRPLIDEIANKLTKLRDSQLKR